MRSFLLAAAAAMLPIGMTKAEAAAPNPGGFAFAGLTGGSIALDDWRGRPVLVVNTASLCGFTRQYDDMQALYERYKDRGLVVLAVPSGDFRQEKASDAAVAEFCQVNFALTFPMTTITPVTGAQAHPFFRWLDQAHGVRPAWNFNKVLLDGDGAFVAHWGSTTRPTSRAITREIEALLSR